MARFTFIAPLPSILIMPLEIPPEDYESVLHVVARFPEGVSVSELLKAPEMTSPRRTLQRRLEVLASEGRPDDPQSQGGD